MNDLVTLINSPVIPWGAGGVVGALVGGLLGQPDCGTIVTTDAGLECAQAILPVIGTPADMAVFVAAGTVIGAVLGYIAGRLNAHG